MMVLKAKVLVFYMKNKTQFITLSEIWACANAVNRTHHKNGISNVAACQDQRAHVRSFYGSGAVDLDTYISNLSHLVDDIT